MWSPGNQYVLFCCSKQNTFYWIENELSQNVLNRVILANKTYTPDTLATELQTKMNAASIMQPTPGYVVTFEEDLGCLNISRSSLPDKTFFFVGDDLLQRLFNPFVIFQTNDNFNGIHSWTLNYKNPKSAMSLLGLGHKTQSKHTVVNNTSVGKRSC